MKKLYVLVGLMMLAFFGLAQTPVRGLKGDYDMGEDKSDFPRISFVWNTANPEMMNKSQFVLTENDINKDFTFEALVNNDFDHPQKSILFLWEDMKTHSFQSDNARQFLIGFFNKTVLNPNDKFNIATFNRKSSSDRSALKPFLSDFVSETDKLMDEVWRYRNSNKKEKDYPMLSDLYLAINEGIAMLKEEPSDRVGIIVVITAGLNMKAAGASTEMETVRKNALDAGIPIYVIKYHELAGNAPEINTLAESTYGKTILLTHTKVDEALIEFQRLYKNLDARCYGQDYRITFTSSVKRDGKPHQIGLSVNRVPQQMPSFIAPDMTFDVWVKENLALFIGLIVLAVGLIALLIVLLVRSANKRKRKDEAFQDQLSDVERKRLEWEKEQELKKQQQSNIEKKNAARKAEEAELLRLASLMKTKNLFPRLQCSVSGSVFSYQINKPLIRVGRCGDNDVILNNQTVSGHHAEIKFTGAAFEIVNKSTTYSQGIIVNGQLFQRITLKSGDIICLGEAVITYYV